MSGALAIGRRGPDEHPDFDRGPRGAVVAVVGLMIAFLVFVLGWAALAQIDVSVGARGAVVPSSRVQEVQSLEGGIVRELLVSPGQKVAKGQALVRLDGVQFDADLGESRKAWLAASAASARFDALLNGHVPRFSVALETEAAELVRQERRQWEEARREYDSSLNTAQDGVKRRAGELSEATGRIKLLEGSLSLAQESFAIEERLLREGAGARADYLNAQQRLQTQRNELDSLRQSLPRLQAGLAEARSQVNEISARARTQWGSQRAELEAKASGLLETLRGREDRVARRELVAPIDGVVNRVLVPTRGGVASPGAAILEIVPNDESLRITVRVKPSDIGFIHAGQQAAVRVLAFDSSIYGKLEAAVERVGADVILDENKQPYFEVQLNSARNYLLHHDRKLQLVAGMPTDVSILTGKRTVLQYLIKPLTKSFDSALQER